MFKIYQFSTVLVHENNMHRHPPQMMITDPTLIQKYNEETLPSVQSMISDLNIKESKSTTMVATQESENPTNKNTIEFVSPSNENTIESVMTVKDATLLMIIANLETLRGHLTTRGIQMNLTISAAEMTITPP
jgi:hypothetical protein